MGYKDTALQAIDDAARVLRDVLASAVAAGAFSEVAAIARAAESLTSAASELRGGTHPPLQAVRAENQSASTKRAAPALAMTMSEVGPDAQPTAPRRQQFPQYLKVGDRLVKRAWSKKERQPYEHKAPREVVDVLLDAIRQHKGDQRPFEAADIMPLSSKAGDEYPSYQSYLALGWLRHSGAIAKGRQGYLLKRGWDESRVAELWDALPSVA